MSDSSGFSSRHTVLLLKYGGIAFVSGAVNHGFFSGTRSLVTAAVGIVLYVLGGWLEMRGKPAQERRWAELLGAGVLLAIGLGLFTGGLQHFPDSPQRSAWVVPLGFVMSAAALYWSEGAAQLRAKPWRYGAFGTAVVAVASAGLFFLLQSKGIGEDMAHSHDHGDSHGAAAPHQHAAAPAPAAATGPARVVEMTMSDAMRFSPSIWQARAGETVVIKVRNDGQLTHELVLGTEAELREHAAQMRAAGTQGMQHSHTNAIRLAPGASGELRWTFRDAGPVGMACFEPGHYEAGMKGRIEVL